ncbi:MAG: Eco57I restriction-modification methylase domain-containing protein [bacterium]|nr:Eco57I restriction-modification methylase domain-containing protein [bacterium]
MKIAQNHLSRTDSINLGSFYTPIHIVSWFYDRIKAFPGFDEYTIVDTSCGYGSFLREEIKNRKIGIDIDEIAISKATAKGAEMYCRNSLYGVSRDSFNIANNESIIIVGNPPYNDTTSIIRSNIKNKNKKIEIDNDIKTRDLGMSFILSYDKLNADYVCILHPLSYIIKRTNFSLIEKFMSNYRLIDSAVFSSSEFNGTSKAMSFPVLAAIYKKDKIGMKYEDIINYNFKTIDGKCFRMSEYDYINRYLNKYPNKNRIKNKNNIVAKFYTMRDVNALRRSRTFIEEDMANTVYIEKEKLPYYCYVDIFKKYTDKIPYYFGNFDIIIDIDEFNKNKDAFIYESISTNDVLKNKFKFREVLNSKVKIEEYFRKLLGEHYVEGR